MTSNDNNQKKELPRLIGFWDGYAITLGAIIGSGIFRTPNKVAENFVSLGPSLMLWVFGGLLALLGALTFAELSSMIPRTGGLYVYLQRGYGNSTAFTFGWAQIWIIRPTSVGALAVFVAELFNKAMGTTLDLRIISLSTIAILTAINIAGVRWGSWVMKICSALKVLALALIISLVIILARGSFSHFEPLFDTTPAKGSFLAAVSVSLVSILWTYDGWCDATYVAGEMKNPQKNMPRSLIFGLFTVIAIYLLANFAYMYTLSPDKLKSSKSVAHDTIETLLGSGFGTFISVAIFISVFGTTNGSILTGARVIFAIAQDKLAFDFLGKKHTKFETPYTALIVQGVMASLLVAWNPSFEDLIGDFVFTIWIFYTASAATIFIFRIKDPAAERPYKCFGYPIVPLLFIILSIGMFINTFAAKPVDIGLRVGIILLAYPIYYFWKSLAKDQAPR